MANLQNLDIILKGLLKNKDNLFLNFDNIKFDRESYENASLYFEKFNIDKDLANLFDDLQISIKAIILAINLYTFNNQHRQENINFFSSEIYECELRISIEDTIKEIFEYGKFNLQEIIKNAILVQYGNLYNHIRISAINNYFCKPIEQCKYRTDFIKEMACEDEIDTMYFDGFLGDYEESYMKNKLSNNNSK